MKLKKVLASILAVAMVLSTMSFTAFADETTVSYAEEFYNAVKDAQSGDVINLTESVTYDVWNSIADKDGITINGNGNTITVTDQVFANGNGGGLLRKASNLVINDLNVVLPKTAEMERLAIMDGGALTNVNVTGGAFAVSIVGNGEVTINNCNFSGIDGWAIETEGKAASASLTISNSTFDEAAVILRGSNNTFTGNTIIGDGEGVNVLGDAVISGNDFGESTLGIDKGVEVRVENNIINNVEFSSWLSGDYSNVTVENNTLSDEVVAEMNDKLEVEVESKGSIKVNGKAYFSLKEAIANAEATDNAVTYEIYGKVEVSGSEAKGWINPIGTSGATTVNFEGMTEDAEISLTHNSADNWVQIMGTSGIQMDAINYSNLTLSKPNGAWCGDAGHANRMFTTWMRGASTSATVTYTNCVFPNGASNNQYGGTVYNNCDFYSDDYYALWIYDAGDNLRADTTPASVEVTGGTFVADRGVKVYSENQDGTAYANTTISDSTFDIESTPAVVSSVDGTITMTDVNYDACEYGLLEMGYLNGNPRYNLADATIDGETPKYVAAVTTKNQWGATSTIYVTDMDYAELVVEKNEAYGEGAIEKPVAMVASSIYVSIEEAIEAAKTVENPVIKIFAGTYNAFTVPAELNNVTFIGETDADGNNLVTIRTLEDDVDTNTRGICVAPETATFKNLNITAGTATNRGGWMTSSLGNTNGDTGFRSNLKQLNVENVNFTGSGEYSAIWMNNGSVNFINSTVENYAYGVYVYAVNDGQVVNVTGSELSTSNRVIFNQEGTVNGKVNVTDSVIDAPMLTIGAGVPATFTDNDISNVAFYIYGETDMEENALIDCEYNTSSNGVINLSENYVNNVNDIVDMALSENINFTNYYVTKADLEAKENLVEVKEKADKVYVQYKKTDVDADGEDTVEGQDTYEIVLAGADAEKINELASADLTFNFNGTLVTGGAMSYTVAPAEGVSLTQLGDRFMFNYDGVNKYEETGASIVIGTITIDGYGSYTLATADSDKNAVYATEIADSIVDGFTPVAGLVINNDMAADDGMVGEITDGVIAVPVRDLTINLDFPNAVADQAIAYQDMKVVISGGDLTEDITIDLGSDAVETALDIFGQPDAKFAAEFVDGSYVINVTDALTVNNAYTVTVSGAGYRTARYTVTMTEDKTLRFWNNVMDEAQFVEIGKDSSKVNVTFLAGDIVKDNNINIYDLSAVVSYFGTEDCVNSYPEYAKYDLNRDDVIDSKDVAYVLVSWNN